MSIGSALYTVSIGPIKVLFELIFSVFYYAFRNPGLSIIALSLSMNILLLPLYKKADEIQENENNIQRQLKDGVDHIKKTFEGDEQYMILNTYYRQNGYKPVYALRSSISLLLQIPFFVAAYDFLSNVPILTNSYFGPISSLGNPDHLLGGINLLPILMTIINIVSSFVYTKGQPVKTNIQLYVMALAFLVFLYNRPSGLVFYWTLNNLFSLIKNIMTSYRTKNNEIVKDADKSDNRLFLVSSLLLCILIGVFIPSSVLVASPTEFIDKQTLLHPLWYVVSCFLLSLGTFFVWIGVYYSLMSNKTKKIISIIMFISSIVFLGNYLFFGTNLGIMSNTLVFDNSISFSIKDIVINLVVSACVVLIILLFKKYNLMIASIISIAIFVVSGINIYKINLPIKETTINLRESKEQMENFRLQFSKNSNNVLFIMFDRSINSYFPFVLNEVPELQEQFKGFTYYPNTLSYGNSTNIAAPALFGGYEYTPDELNKRDTELLVDKHNESLKVLPVLFDINDYDVTVCDSPLGNYKAIADLSIFDEYKDIKTYVTEGAFTINEFSNITSLEKLKRNLFVYSITKVSPLALQSILYNSGLYHDTNYLGNGHLSNYNSFLNCYSVLLNLKDRTVVDDSVNNVFISFTNNTAHDSAVVQEPGFYPAITIDNTEYDREHSVRQSIYGRELVLKTDWQYIHYLSNVAAYKQIGEWFDYLREIGVYDNTRIVIASDHGAKLNQFDEWLLDDINDEIVHYNPILLVKDFNSKDFNVDYQFMTNADVPTLLTEGLIDSPLNPFTGNRISNESKEGPQLVSASHENNFLTNNGTTFLPGPWYSVDHDVLDLKSWHLLDRYD